MGVFARAWDWILVTFEELRVYALATRKQSCDEGILEGIGYD